MLELNDLVVCAALKCRQSADGPLPGPAEHLSKTVITWPASSGIEMMDSEHNKNICMKLFTILQEHQPLTTLYEHMTVSD